MKRTENPISLLNRICRETYGKGFITYVMGNVGTLAEPRIEVLIKLPYDVVMYSGHGWNKRHARTNAAISVLKEEFGYTNDDFNRMATAYRRYKKRMKLR